MACLPQLIDAHDYRPCDWDLKADLDGLKHWLGVFRDHLPFLLELIANEYPDAGAERIDAFRRDYLAALAHVEQRPDEFGRVDILRLTEIRRDIEDRHGFHDPFRLVKERENAAALRALPGRLAELDAMGESDRFGAILDGLLAGNLFDLGAMSIVDRYRSRSEAHGIGDDRDQVSWLIDDRSRFEAKTRAGGYAHVVFFPDNCGSDIFLGCIPFIRNMLRNGTRVTLAANSSPALNDVTHSELSDLFGTVAESGLVSGWSSAIKIVPSGSTTPLLDLTALPEDSARACRDADLIILHGMGRALESNWNARFRCDVLRTAALKDEMLARRLGGQLFDRVFRFTTAAE